MSSFPPSSLLLFSGSGSASLIPLMRPDFWSIFFLYQRRNLDLRGSSFSPSSLLLILLSQGLLLRPWRLLFPPPYLRELAVAISAECAEAASRSPLPSRSVHFLTVATSLGSSLPTPLQRAFPFGLPPPLVAALPVGGR